MKVAVNNVSWTEKLEEKYPNIVKQSKFHLECDEPTEHCIFYVEPSDFYDFIKWIEAETNEDVIVYNNNYWKEQYNCDEYIVIYDDYIE
jgi:hypothetical protein